MVGSFSFMHIQHECDPYSKSFEKSVEINTIGLIQAFSFRRGLFLCLLISNFGDVIKVETDFFANF